MSATLVLVLLVVLVIMLAGTVSLVVACGPPAPATVREAPPSYNDAVGAVEV